MIIMGLVAIHIILSTAQFQMVIACISGDGYLDSPIYFYYFRTDSYVYVMVRASGRELDLWVFYHVYKLLRARSCPQSYTAPEGRKKVRSGMTLSC